MIKHTPGPWKATHSIPAEGYDCWWITANLGHNREKEITSVDDEANARLIAAAPDLLKALQEIEKGADAKAFVCAMARAAIAKATGAQP